MFLKISFIQKLHYLVNLNKLMRFQRFECFQNFVINLLVFKFYKLFNTDLKNFLEVSLKLRDCLRVL